MPLGALFLCYIITFLEVGIPERGKALFGDAPGIREELLFAIADSKCEAVTVGDYPGGLTTNNDRKNLLPAAANEALPPVLNRKARVVYEFDAAGTMKDNYLYVAMARKWRSMGVQVACQFQYDSAALSDWNIPWGTHYLNWLYTPGKSVAFLICEELFDRIPRDTAYKFNESDDQVFQEFAVSYKHNLAMLSSPDALMYTNSLDQWIPLDIPKSPRIIAGIGRSPYIDYDGTGLYVIRVASEDFIELEVTPDVEYFRHTLDTPNGPVAKLLGGCLKTPSNFTV